MSKTHSTVLNWFNLKGQKLVDRVAKWVEPGELGIDEADSV